MTERTDNAATLARRAQAMSQLPDARSTKPATIMEEDAAREKRFWTKVDKDGPIPEYKPDLGPCWIWTGSLTTGYGSFWDGRLNSAGHPRKILAHRFVWFLVGREIPEGMEIDHLCRVRRCVNPSHLEPVTRSENMLRSPIAGKGLANRATCRRGHEWSNENTLIRKDGSRAGTRCCRVCNRIYQARARQRKAARSAARRNGASP